MLLLPFIATSAVPVLAFLKLKSEDSRCGAHNPPLEVIPLVVSGPSSNRVDLIFFSDGYLQGEREKFVQDATRLADDISGNQTFNTVKPLMNFWAAFTPSKESGVGVGGKPKEQLRGVYYAKPKVAGAACSSLVVITPSIANGALILRHELGHSIINTGEEYDGGFATPWSVTFESSGAYARHLVRFSVSGMPERSDLKVDLDGIDLGWVPRANIGLDRYHYDVAGPHTLTFTLLNGNREPAAQMCNAEILELAMRPSLLRSESSPTNEDCLMRQVTTPNFCKACLEAYTIEESCSTHADPSVSTLTLRLVPLAQLRATAVLGLDESYTITWSKDGAVLPGLTNKTQVDVAPGTYSVDVKYSTTEVRVDPKNLLTARMEYTVSKTCARARTMMMH
ncbi:IgA peptidase M64-domain-containing protein [Mycena leptocephala]|nr:IgA peptidase M64-domain-containing protein [Mycena leptocephala]